MKKKEIPNIYKRKIENKLLFFDEFSKSIHEYLSNNIATSIQVCKEFFENCKKRSRNLEKITKKLKRLKKHGLVYAVGNDKKYVSLFHLAQVLFELGPSTKEEVARALNLSLNEAKSALEQAYKKELLGKFGRSSNKNPVFYLLTEEEKKKAKFKGIKYAKKVYEILSDGYKTSREVGKLLNLNRKNAWRILRELRKKVSWLECKKIVGFPSLIWFRKDKTEEIQEILEKEKSSLMQKIKDYILNEPRKSKEIIEEFDLNKYETLKLLEEMEKLNMVNKIEGPGANVTVWYANKNQEVKAKFKSKNPRYGSKIFEIFSKEIVLPAKKIQEELNIGYRTTYNLLNKFKSHGLIGNVPNYGWFLITKELENILKVVKKGMKGFEFKYEGGIYFLEPTKNFSVSQLQAIAESEGIAIRYDNSFIFPKSLDWFSYRKFSGIVFKLLDRKKSNFYSSKVKR